MRYSIALCALTLVAAACSPEPAADADSSSSGPASTGSAPAGNPGTVDTAERPADVLTLDGLGALQIGQPVPSGSSWAERGAQIPGSACKTLSSPDFPGAYAIVEGGEVRRISVGDRSGVKVIEGIGPGSTEAAVRQAFPGFRETPHKYVEAPGKYLTAPGAEEGGPALRFEIGQEGTVSIVHAGLWPQLGYVEGCA
jgi:hypothetical protein